MKRYWKRLCDYFIAKPTYTYDWSLKIKDQNHLCLTRAEARQAKNEVLFNIKAKKPISLLSLSGETTYFPAGEVKSREVRISRN